MFQTKAVEEIKTHILCSVTFFENLVVKHCRAGQASEDNMAHANCMPDA